MTLPPLNTLGLESTFVAGTAALLALVLTYLTYRASLAYRRRLRRAQEHVDQTSTLHLATIEALARAIDAKDQTAQSRIRRIQFHAGRLAAAAGMSPDEIQGVKTAALLHDIGQLAVPEHILSKPGPLTDEEFQKVRIHPQVGAEIIASVPFPYPVAPIILSHHERWDGKGYPHGLVDEAIPLGARILTIVDFYDAVTAERPYHPAHSHDSAIGLMKQEAGRALDPGLTHLFIDMLPRLLEEADADAADAAPASVLFGQHSIDSGATAAANGTAFENIALAHREIYALYEIAQSMGTSLGVSDTMALISSKIAKIVPWSGCALFLAQTDKRTLKCRYATGIDAPRLLDATIALSQGMPGSGPEEPRTLMNVDPRATFSAAGLDPATPLRSALVCPLFFGDAFIGNLALYHTGDIRYSDDHRRLIERVAEQAGAVLHNSIVFEQTQEDSLTDPLTMLPNRRWMFMHLQRELQRAERHQTEVALIVMDIDNFKAINDNHGHHTGDRALRAVASALTAGLRPYDLCVRYAGDEFILVLTNCSREAAEAKRREMQDRVAAIALSVRSDKTIQLSASVGAAVFPDDGPSYEELLAEADQRMYRDKASRRGVLPVVRSGKSPDSPRQIRPFLESLRTN